MNKFKLLLTGAVILMWPVTGHAFVIDGMIDDWGVDLTAPASSSINYLDNSLPTGERSINFVTEDNADDRDGWQYVIPGWSFGGNLYDAEAMYVDNDDENLYLAIVSGMPEEGAPTPDGEILRPGDIGFDIDGNGIYEYALNIRDSYIYSVNSWIDPIYSSFAASAGPWIIGDGEQIGETEFVYSSNQNTHYVMEAKISLDLLGLNNAYIGAPVQYLNVNWTVECGNDYLNLPADVNPIPEPATIFLFSIGLLGIARFKKRFGLVS